MSSQALGALSEAAPAGEAAAQARIAQLQELIERTSAAAAGASAGAAGASSAGEASSGSFAAALQAAASPEAGTGAATAASVSAGMEGEPSSAAGSSPSYEALIAAAAQRNGVDPAVLHGLIQQESGFDPASQSSAGAMGLTQLMPGTASSLGVANPLDPAESIEGGARYLAEMMSRFGGNTADALAAYNAGPGAVQHYGGVPPYAETQGYVQKVLGYAETYRHEHQAPPSLGSIA